MQNKFFKYGIFFAILVVCVSCDQSTKRLAKEQLSFSPPIEYLDGTFKLIYAENTGAFLGLGDSLPPNLKYLLLVFLPTLVLFIFAVTYLRASASFTQFIGMSFIIAGGIGNMIDRITHGKVVDFMNIDFGNIRTGIFNFADVAVSFGLILLLFHIFTSKNK